MSFFGQRIHWKAIASQVGLLLHVPAGLATFSLLICMIFQEWFGIIPFLTTALIGFGLGHLSYRIFFKNQRAAHLWDAMIIVAIGWLLSSFLAALPIYWIAAQQIQAGVSSEALAIFARPVNALFESFSAFTITGLTMLQKPGPFPHVLQWWRSLLEWAGGLGIVIAVLALTHLNLKGFQLYYAEAHTEQISKKITQTAHWLWFIYFLLTLLAIILFFSFGMPIWEAINHGMTAISTGGFTTTETSFTHYNLGIQFCAVFIMILGATNFLIHFKVIRHGQLSALWKDNQNRLFYICIFLGWLIIVFLIYWNHNQPKWINSFFQWVSVLTTCGFSAGKISIFSPMVKLFIVIGMFIGGSTGSTAGGLKQQRLIYLISGVFLRLKSLTQKNEKEITGKYKTQKRAPRTEPAGLSIPLTEKSKRLFTAGILFFLWTFTLLLGWFFILHWTPPGLALDALFDVTSALSNVGLTSGLLTPEFSSAGKAVFMFLMWIGRLEVIPAIVLILSLPMSIKQKRIS